MHTQTMPVRHCACKNGIMLHPVLCMPLHPMQGSYLLREGRVEHPVSAKALEKADRAPEDPSKTDILSKAQSPAQSAPFVM